MQRRLSHLQHENRKLQRELHVLKGRRIALLGLTFKPNTDDMRDSPAIAVIQTLQDAGAAIQAYDPEGMEMAKPLLEGVTYCTGPYEAMQGADAAVDSMAARRALRAQMRQQPRP